MTTGGAAARRHWLVRAGMALAAAASLVLAGCASTAISQGSELHAGEGVVTIRVVSLHERTLHHLTVTNLDTQQQYMLWPQPALGGGSYRFTGIVPAGRYETKELYGLDVRDLGTVQQTLKLTVPLAGPSHRFEVADGGLANLGSLVFVPLAASRFFAAREETPVAARDWLRYANPGLAAKLQAGKETGWLAPVREEDRALLHRQLDYARGQTSPRSIPVLDDQGNAWRAGKLGSVFDLAARKRFDTGTVHELTSVAVLADGRLLAAGEEAYVAVSSPDRRSWREVPAPLSKASAALLVTQAPDGTVYLVSRTPVGVTVHAADPAAFTWSWRELRRIERESIASTEEGRTVAFRSMGQAKPDAVATRERLVIYTPDPEWLTSLDFRTGAWEAHKTESRVVRMRGSPQGVVVTMNAAPAFWATADYGKTWFEVDKFFNTTLPVFTSATDAYVLAMPFAAMTKTQPALFKTADAGKTWKPVGGLPPNKDVYWSSGQLVHDPAGQRLGYVSADGRVTWTRDEGLSWR